jgi:hypothetical protein
VVEVEERMGVGTESLARSLEAGTGAEFRMLDTVLLETGAKIAEVAGAAVAVDAGAVVGIAAFRREVFVCFPESSC